MSKRLFRLMILLAAVVMVTAQCGGGATPAPEEPAAPAAKAPTAEAPMPEEPTAVAVEEKPDLIIIWFAWQPCEALGELSAKYEGANVTVNCVPFGEWYNTTFTDFAAQGGADLVIMDSQWIGEAVVGGHVMDLTDFMAANIDTADYVPAALSAYGEYPPGSKKYSGVAIEGDTQMLVYRKDLFEKAGFEPPQSWSELLTQAQSFKDGDLIENGYATFWCGDVACYDQIATVWNQMAWSFGGELWDPNTYQIDGILNSPENLSALEFAKELFKTGPEGAANFDFDKTVGAVCSGSTAMVSIWFGFGAAFLDPTGCAESANLAFAVLPGEKEHYISLGGMGLSVSSYTKHPDAALDYLKWVESEDIQLEWAKLGGFSARKSVLASDTFKNATPYNPTFAESYLLVRDFWNVPEYAALLEPQMKYLNLAVSGQMDPQEALDEIAIQQQEILDEAYPDGPPK